MVTARLFGVGLLNVIWPLSVPDLLSPPRVRNGTMLYMTPALAPGAAEPWMCASLKVPEIPEKDPLRVIVVPVRVRLKMPEPVRAPPPSCAPLRVAMKLCAEARQGRANAAAKERSIFISVEGIVR